MIQSLQPLVPVLPLQGEVAQMFLLFLLLSLELLCVGVVSRECVRPTKIVSFKVDTICNRVAEIVHKIYSNNYGTKYY